MTEKVHTPKRIEQPGLLVLFIIGALIFTWAAWVASARVMTTWEMTIFGEINQWSNHLRWPGLIISQFGDVAAYITAVLGFFLFGRRLIAVRLFLAGGGSYVFSWLVKHVVDRPRPVDLVQPVYTRVHETGMGFPSGHTTMAAALSIVIAYSLGKRWYWLPFIWVPLVAIDRIYLGVHAPLDVIGGFAVGAMGASFILVSEKLWKKLVVKA